MGVTDDGAHDDKDGGGGGDEGGIDARTTRQMKEANIVGDACINYFRFLNKFFLDLLSNSASTTILNRNCNRFIFFLTDSQNLGIGLPSAIHPQYPQSPL